MSRPRTPHLRALLFAFVALALPCFAAASTIGLYTDENGSSCSFSGNDPGIVSAYVVIRPDASGVRGVRFSAPIPPCFGAIFVTENAPPGANFIGSSPTGVSVAFPDCAPTPVYALQIQYFRSNTTPCCAFTIAPDPFVGMIEGTDCAFQAVELTPVVSHFNADASCPCNDLTDPLPPLNPSPLDGLTTVNVLSGLSWDHSPFDYDIASYDLYIGTDPSPAFVGTLTQPSYQPTQPLQELTQYYWRVVVRDDDGHTTSGPVWKFKTKAANSPPGVPALFNPQNGSLNVSVVTPLQWIATDPDGDVLEYDIYLGNDPANLPLYAAAVHSSQYVITTPLAYSTTYTWKVVARDPLGHETPSAPAQFTTRPNNYAPNAADSPSPANNAIGVTASLTLSWHASDLDPGQALTFDVYMGTSNPPPLVVSNHPNTSYTPATLAYGAKYFWKIVTRDPFGATSTSSIWNFTIRPENYPPAVPSSPSPSHGANNVALNATLSWQCTDADGDPITYSVYFGLTDPPPQVAGDLTARTYSPGLLAVQTRYYWQIVARDSKGASTPGPVWSFTSQTNHPPLAPSSPSPANNASNQLLQLHLSWTCTDNDPGQTLTYDVYFGTTISPPKIISGLPTPGYDTPVLSPGSAYFWYVVAKDNLGATTTGSLWKFTTGTTIPPTLPSNPVPSDGASVASNAVLLQWDAPAQFTQFAISFGTSPTPPLAGQSTTHSFDPGLLTYGVTYYWNVTEYDGVSSARGPTWSFTVTGGEIPVLFSSFAAEVSAGAARVAWELHSDEAVQSYTIYRREEGKTFSAVSSAAVTGTSGSFLDRNVEGSRRYNYQMVVQAANGDEFRSQIASVSMPSLELTLGPNHPNPFNPQTAIPYYLPSGDGPTRVRVIIYDSSGHVVRVLVNENQSAGAHEVTWNGGDMNGATVTSGIYFCVLQVGKEQRTQKLVLLK